MLQPKSCPIFKFIFFKFPNQLFLQKNRKRRNRKKKSKKKRALEKKEQAEQQQQKEGGEKEKDPEVEIEYVTEEPEIYDPNFIFFKRIFEAFKVSEFSRILIY